MQLFSKIAALALASTVLFTTAVQAEQKQSANTTLYRDDGLWVEISMKCGQKCERENANYQQIVDTMQAAGFSDKAPVGISMSTDIAYRISVTPTMGSSIAYAVDTPHPGLSATLSNSMSARDVSMLPTNLSKLHESFQAAMNGMTGDNARMVRISTQP